MADSFYIWRQVIFPERFMTDYAVMRERLLEELGREAARRGAHVTESEDNLTTFPGKPGYRLLTVAVTAQTVPTLREIYDIGDEK